MRDAHVHGSPEADEAREMLREQLTVLFSRYGYEDVILVKVLAEHYQHAAETAKSGRLTQARAELTALANKVPVPAHAELVRVVDAAALPAWALVCWKEGDCGTARTLLREALDACAELAGRYGHHHLTGKRLHLAINLARVAISEGDRDGAGALLAALRAVTLGDRAQWPFAQSASLEVPLSGSGRTAIDAELERTARRLAGPSG